MLTAKEVLELNGKFNVGGLKFFLPVMSVMHDPYR